MARVMRLILCLVAIAIVSCQPVPRHYVFIDNIHEPAVVTNSTRGAPRIQRPQPHPFHRTQGRTFIRKRPHEAANAARIAAALAATSPAASAHTTVLATSDGLVYAKTVSPITHIANSYLANVVKATPAGEWPMAPPESPSTGGINQSWCGIAKS